MLNDIKNKLGDKNKKDVFDKLKNEKEKEDKFKQMTIYKRLIIKIILENILIDGERLSNRRNKIL